MATQPLTNPLLDPAHLAILAQQAQQTAPPVIRPPQTDSAPPPISTSPMGSGAPPKLPAPNMPSIAQAKSTQPAGKITPQMKADALVPKMQDAAPEVPPIRIGGDEMPSMSAPDMPDVVKHVPTQLENDKGRLAHIADTGSGISQISGKIQGAMPNHPLAGKLLGGFAQGLATLGDVGLRAVAPSVDLALPGTSLHHLADLHGANKQIGVDEAAQESEAQQRAHDATTAHETQETAGLPRAQQDTHDLTREQIENLDSEVTERGKPTFTVHDTEEGPLLVGKDGTAQHLTVGGQPIGPKLKLTQSQPIIDPKDGKPHTYMLDDKGNKKVDLGVHYERPQVTNVNAGLTALDRESKQFGAPHQKSIDAANAQLEKIEDARNMVNGDAESQALGLPKVLTALVSGQGSGVRITQPELNAIAKARGLTGDVEGTLNSWSGKGKLTKTQQQQLTGILDDVKARILKKQAIASGALDSINGASSREEIIAADKAARQQLNDLETGNAQHFQATSSDGKWGYDGSKWVAIGGGK